MDSYNYQQPELNSKKTTLRRKLNRFLTVAVLVALLTVGYYSYQIYSATSKVTGDKNPLQLVSLLNPSQLKQTNGRVNILLAGYSVDDPGHQGAELTDSVMIVSINPETKAADLISIPRDTWVEIPGFGYQKINAAYEDGQIENFKMSGYPNGGMGLLEEVVDQDFGVQSDYYGLLDYQAFEDTVDAVGGITVDIQSTDSRGLYDPNTNLNLPNGEVTLNGQQALNLARARGDGAGSYGFTDGDFDRTEHQQQMLVALTKKATTASVYANPVKLSKLITAVGNNFKTDLTIGDMVSLYRDSNNIDLSTAKTLTLNDYNGQDLLASYYTPNGQDALIPAAGLDDFSQIEAAIQNTLDSN
jgi:LCP family protein required for cell wall assembly